MFRVTCEDVGGSVLISGVVGRSCCSEAVPLLYTSVFNSSPLVVHSDGAKSHHGCLDPTTGDPPKP